MNGRFAFTILASLFSAGNAVSQSSTIRHIVVSVAATNDEWTTTGLSVAPDDILIVTVPGTIRVGQVTGEVDANGARPPSKSSSGYGVLEYKIGVGAGKPSGAFSLLRPDGKGELKFRVKDSRYDDNSGAFDVDIVVIPEAAVPSARRVGEPAAPDMTLASSKAERAAMISFLHSLRTAEETFFTDSNRYTDKIGLLPAAQLPSGVSVKSIAVGPKGEGWKAVVTSSRLPGIQCAVAVAMANPIESKAGEGEAICKL